MPPKKKGANADEDKPTAARFGRVKNTLKMGIVGLPNVGKSSLFNLLAKQALANAANFPFATIDPQDARCAVPDERFDYLVDMWKSPSVIPAALNITDIAGLVRGAAEGAGLGNAFLSHVQAVDGLYHVVRAFDDDDIVHVDDSVDALRDVETITSELCKKDLEELDRAIDAHKMAIKKSQGAMKMTPLFEETMAKVRELLEANMYIRSHPWTPAQVALIREHLRNFITTKAMVYLCNLSKKDFLRKKNKWLAKLHAWIQEHGGGTLIPFSVAFEEELFALKDDPAGQEAFLKECGDAKSSLDKIITTGYHELNLIHFFTAGDKEVRCWTVFGGALAPQAAGVIHSDFERGFIKAEVVSFSDFKELQKSKGMSDVKAAGKYRQEGKSYVMQDGDIVNFQFNVTAPAKKK